MFTILFWNLGKKPLVDSITRLALQHQIDLIALTECLIEPEQLLLRLNQIYPTAYDYAPNPSCRRLQIFTRFPRQYSSVALEDERLVVRTLQIPRFRSAILVAMIHFQAVMSRQVAQLRTRKLQEREYPFFYNPMWSLLGDATPGPPGTYYYSPSGHASYYWHTFDQVLLRPDLLDVFENRDLHILDTDGEQSFK